MSALPCPTCQRPLQIKLEHAGKRVKCPACGAIILIPVAKPIAQVAIQRSREDLIAKAVESQDPTAVAQSLHGFFTLLNASEDEDHGAMTAELDGIPVLLAFTSQKYASHYLYAMDEGNAVSGFVVSGKDMLKQLPKGMGVLLNPKVDEAQFLNPKLVARVKPIIQKMEAPVFEEEPLRESVRDPIAKQIRDNNYAQLTIAGFQPSTWLPLPDLTRQLRSHSEIASRLMSLAGVFCWATAPEEAIATDQLRNLFRIPEVRNSLSNSEKKILGTSRKECRATHAATVGWKLENMWPLAWAIGLEEEPIVEAAQISPAIIESIVFVFLGRMSLTLQELLSRTTPRSVEDVLCMEDLFYLAHNAVRSAQMGHQVVPSDFDPVAHGGVIHERRHALTWMLSDCAWDDTDLST